MKVAERLIRIALILMIAVSLYLTYLIWVSPANQDDKLVGGPESNLQENANYREAAEIFLPLRLTRIQNEDLAETNTESLVRSVQDLLTKAQYRDAQLITFESHEEYLEHQQMSEGMELSYIAEMPMKDYLATFPLTLDLDANQRDAVKFFKIQVDFEHEEIRFINGKKNTILEASFETDLNDLMHIIQNNSADWIEVIRNNNLVPAQLFTSEPVSLKTYSYLLAVRPYTVFRDAFFTNPKNIVSSDGTTNVSLYDGPESMTIQPNEQTINFRGSIAIDDNFSIYQASYRYIRGLGSNYGSMRLFDQKNNTADYRIFVEGFPVFSEQEEGRITVNFSNVGESSDANVEIKANLTTIQVPIPSDKKVELPPSQEVLQTLHDNGAEADKLKKIIVGYTWKNLQESRVVDLEPDWYVQYDNKWYSHGDLLTYLTESEEQSNGF